MTETEPVTNDADVIDSRDVIARIEYLSVIRTPGPVPEGLLSDEDAERDQDELFHELNTLERLATEGDSLPDWQYGEALIRDTYFEEYARELAEEIGAVPTDLSWPAYCIDWGWAARELRMDYTSLDFDGVTYWARS